MRGSQSSGGSLGLRRTSGPPNLVVGRAQFVGLEQAEGAPITPETVAAALSVEFSVGFGPPSVVRVADLDTFDRRLRAAGFSLHHLYDPVDQRLVLTSPCADMRLTTPIMKVRWPA